MNKNNISERSPVQDIATYIIEVSGLIREYIRLRFPSKKNIVIDDMHISIYQDLLNSDEDIEDVTFGRKVLCIQLLKVLSNKNVSDLLSDRDRKHTAEMLVDLIRFYEIIEGDFHKALMHITIVEQFGQCDIGLVECIEDEYFDKVELAKQKVQYEVEKKRKLALA